MDVDHVGWPNRRIALGERSMGVDVAMQNQPWLPPFGGPADRVQALVGKVGAFVDAGRRPVQQQDVERSPPQAS